MKDEINETIVIGLPEDITDKETKQRLKKEIEELCDKNNLFCKQIETNYEYEDISNSGEDADDQVIFYESMQNDWEEEIELLFKEDYNEKQIN